MSFRKFFKFQVLKPLDVQTKFYNAETDEVILEATVRIYLKFMDILSFDNFVVGVKGSRTAILGSFGVEIRF